MAVHTKSIEKIVAQALRRTPADQLDIYALIKMSPDEVETRGNKNPDFTEAFAEAQAAIALAANATTSTKSMVEQAKRDVEEAKETAEGRRRAYVSAVREIKAQEGRLDHLTKSQDIFSLDNIYELLREFRYVKNNPVIESVEIVQEGVPEMVIRTKPLIIEYKETSYRFENLDFAIDLSDLKVQWLEFRSPSSERDYVHPHISTGGIICWGDAQTLIQEAQEHRDIAGLVKIITDWMTLYNDRSPYVRIENFPVDETGARPGWQL